MIKLIECPRDAMQGIKKFIPTRLKAKYINQLLRVGFDTIDFGSFVSPKAIPQMRDTGELIRLLDLDGTDTKLLAIVANKRGAADASQFEEIRYLGYPFSISETFQMRNTNSTIKDSLVRVADIQEICLQSNKKLVVYLSMGFGNPYGDEWNVDIVESWTTVLFKMGVKIIQLSDTIGVSSPESIQYLFGNLIPAMPQIEFGAHLHTPPSSWHEKVESAYQSGCRRFDGAIRGFGGCPMAKDELTGNMATENLYGYFQSIDVSLSVDEEAFRSASAMADTLFSQYH